MFTTITDTERSTCGVSQLADSPNLTAAQLKEQFDSLANLAVDKFITHINEITAITAADNIGATVPGGILSMPTVQKILDAYAEHILGLEEAKHTHANKASLDAITAEVKASYDKLVTLFSAIEMVENLLSDNDKSVPTSHAVKAYIDTKGFMNKTTAINTFYPVGTVYSTNISSFNPSSTFGGGWNTLTWPDDTSGLKHFVRVT
jgi:hypothetical protein